LRIVNIEHNQLSAPEINKLFHNLTDKQFPEENKLIKISGNPGTNNDDVKTDIAKEKLWTVNNDE